MPCGDICCREERSPLWNWHDGRARMHITKDHDERWKPFADDGVNAKGSQW